ncbi:MAG: TonB-dependent receptor [Bacteroidota bacterium]|nr:TonB-dependent receptor [Bacteroidota bacterium]
MKNFLYIVALLCYSVYGNAQNDTTLANLDEVIIYSGKFAERKKNIAQKVDVITARQIAQTNAQNTGDLLINTGNVFVQKSQQGGSSPVLRGFEASRVLLVIDGIRMNNAIYRAGHLQNVITVDQNSLERVEVLYGPASTLYGSDALGGVILLRTKSPKFSTSDGLFTTGSAFVRYSTANDEKTAHSDISIGGKKFAWLQAYNYSNFGDLRMGSHYPGKYPDFGRRSQYIAPINGVDSVVTNRDDRVQRFSGYRQWDITQKFAYRQTDRITHSLNVQHSNSSNVPRYDRLQDVRNGTLRYADWYYGPQTRYLGAYEFNTTAAGFFDEVRANANFQQIEESRHQREYRRYDRLDNRLERLKVWGFLLDGRKLWNKSELTVGADAQLNNVTSTAFRQNIQTGAASPLDSRYPNGENKMNYIGVYAQHLLKLAGGKIIINDGVRLQAVSLRSTIRDNSFFNFPFTKIEHDNVAVTGNLGVVYLPSESSRLTASLSSGFRAPNVDDVARIFESNTASRQLIVPNPNIGPEYTYNADLGFTHTIRNIRVEVTGFYTWFRNAIALSPFRFQEQDSITYNGTRVKVYANQNVNKAHLFGFNANVTADFAQHFRFYSTLTYTRGRLLPENGTEVPLDHIPPVYGKTSLSFTAPVFSAELYTLYNGWKRIKDYNPSGEDNAQYATPEGTPSWLTLNLKTTVPLHKQLQLQVGVENILDRNYRYFASGFSAPGRNVVVALRSSF